MHGRTLDEAGWLRVPALLSPSMLRALPLDSALETASEAEVRDTSAGSRNALDWPWCAALVEPIRARLRALGVLSADAVAVQCTLFRKTPDCNWKVPYHQDLSVPVATRIDEAGLSGWAMKEDGEYVQPPTALLASSLAVRVHLDPCPADSGALRVLPGSHRWGRIDAERIATLDKREREVVCEAEAGDAILMRPLLLHASSKARAPNGRRVLHFLFAPREPGSGLSWRISL